MSATDTYLLLRAFCDELARCGMGYACTSPGSRSTPLVLSLVREPRIQCFSHIDERSAGFFALGAAKASAAPVAVCCTSGTAAANYLPAVIEAHHGGVPMIVLTADRPPELRELGAGQTIDQVKLYGGAVKWFFEVGVHDATPERLRWMRQLACRAFWTAAEGRPGPVHLNFPLREPLVLDQPLPEDPVPGRADGRPWVSFEAARPPATLPADVPVRTVIIAGTGEPGSGARLAEQAEQARLPLLADPLSGARRGRAAIAHYDLLLRDERFTARHPPQCIIRVGELPTSKPLRRWLAELDGATQTAVAPPTMWHDPDSVVARRIHGPISESATPAGDDDWLRAWRDADEAVRAAVSEAIGDELSEPAVAARLTEWLPEEAILFVASSMPIRDVEEFMPVSAAPPLILANRGANGIDGTVSAAFGAAAVSPVPVVLLIGDVALAHDLGGLLCARRLGLSLTIVLLNNDGGGIFHFLPVVGEEDAFEEHVATPHGLDFARAAAFYGISHERPKDLGALRDAVRRSLARPGTEILELHTERRGNRELHRHVEAAARQALPG